MKIKRRHTKQVRINVDLSNIITTLHPDKYMPEATKLIAIDIYNGVDLRKKLKKALNGKK